MSHIVSNNRQQELFSAHLRIYLRNSKELIQDKKLRFR